MGHPPEDDWKYAPGTTRKTPEAAAADDQGKARFSVNGAEYDLADVDDLDFGELETIEDAFGMPAEEIDWRRAKAMRWLIYISMKRAGANVEFDDLRNIQFSAIQDAEGPTAPAADAA